jgi:hypothetical protein
MLLSNWLHFFGISFGFQMNRGVGLNFYCSNMHTNNLVAKVQNHLQNNHKK